MYINNLINKLDFPMILLFCLVVNLVILFCIMKYVNKKKILKTIYKKNPLDLKHIIQSILLSIISFFLFYLLLITINYLISLELISIWLIKQYVLLAMLGSIAITFKLYFLGIIYYFSLLFGYIINCIILSLQQNYPTMLGGLINGLIIMIGFIIGIIIEIIIRKKYKKLYRIKIF